MRGVRWALTASALGITLSLIVFAAAVPALAGSSGRWLRAGGAGGGVTIVGSQDGAISLMLTGSSPDVVLTLQQQGAPGSVKVSITPFRSADGQTYEVESPPSNVTFSNGLGTLTLPVDLPYGGPYTALLALTEGSVSTMTTVSVTRSQGVAPFTVDGATTVSADTYGGHWQSVTRIVTITETTGRQLTIQAPVIVSPSRSFSGQTVDASISLKGFTPDSSGPNCTMSKQVKGKPAELTIKAGQACRLYLDLEVPAGAGSYSTTLRFLDPGYEPVDQAVVVQLRRPWWYALVMVALGVGLAAGIRLWWIPRGKELEGMIEVERARVDLQTAVATLPSGLSDLAVKVAFQGLTEVLDKAEEAAGKNDSDAADRLKSVRSQIAAFPAWAALAPQFEAARANLSQELQNKWADLTRRLICQDPADANADSLYNDLNSFQEDLRGASVPTSTPGETGTRQVVAAEAPETPRGRVRPLLSRLITERKINEGLLLAVALIAATLTGLVALYSGNATWGDFGDFITAVLWGLGVTAGTAGVVGFNNVQQAMTG